YESVEEQSLNPRRLAIENPSFAILVRACQERLLIPLELSKDEVREYLDRYRNNLLAARSYVAYPIPIPLHLFAAENAADVECADGLHNWEVVLPAEQVRSISVPGNHLSMMESPHITSLGAALSRAIRQSREIKVSQPEKDYCPMWSIRSAQYGAAPVVCIPGAGNTASSFLDLASTLGGLRPIEGLQPRGLGGVVVPHTTGPAAARAYLQAVQQKYPDGPVHLLGHSFGGWIAFEMAQLLRGAGRSVASLTILDSEVPYSDRVF